MTPTAQEGLPQSRREALSRHGYTYTTWEDAIIDAVEDMEIHAEITDESFYFECGSQTGRQEAYSAEVTAPVELKVEWSNNEPPNLEDIQSYQHTVTVTHYCGCEESGDPVKRRKACSCRDVHVEVALTLQQVTLTRTRVHFSYLDGGLALRDHDWVWTTEATFQAEMEEA